MSTAKKAPCCKYCGKKLYKYIVCALVPREAPLAKQGDQFPHPWKHVGGFVRAIKNEKSGQYYLGDRRISCHDGHSYGYRGSGLFCSRSHGYAYGVIEARKRFPTHQGGGS